MSAERSLEEHRKHIRDHYLEPEEQLAPAMVAAADLDQALRDAAQERAAEFVRAARAGAARSGLIDKFLQEYGLSTAEGVTLMRLAEALLRTPDAATADALIEDKIEAGDWASHQGKSPFPLVNFSTRALMLTSAWLDDVEPKDPLGKMAARTKAVLDRLGEPVIRASVGQAMRIMGEHFVLGETIEAAMKRARGFAEKGYVFSFDMLGEAARTDRDALKYFDDYSEAIAAISKHSTHARAADNPGISVKLSALHPRYEYTNKERVLNELGERIRDLAVMARNANMGFNIDAEEADRLDISLDIMEMLMRDPALAGWDGFGVVIQSYQRRAMFVIDWLATLARDTGRRVMVRLVKGAYWDSEIKRAQVMGLESYPVYTRKVLTDVSFIACARKLLEARDVFYPQFATHNALTAAMVQAMAGDGDDYELQRLHGMGEALHDKLLATGSRSRIYAPVGGHKELLPYLVRRLLENGANSSFVNQLIDPDLSVDDVVADPFDEIAELETYPNPLIPAPRDHLGGRLAAKGWDETHPPTAAAMSPAARETLPYIYAHALIDGATPESRKNDEAIILKNPARPGDAIGEVSPAAAHDVNRACEQAAAFAGEWAATRVRERADVIRRAADLLEERGEHFMALCVFEAGKSWPDAIAEVREAVDFLRYYPDRAEALTGEPVGVIACISPWNFPLAIFLGQITGSLCAGNCVIAKPAEQTPLIAFEAVKLLFDAGVPAGALYYLPGDGPSVGAPLTSNPNINGVVFTGSTGTAQAIKKTLVESGRHDAALIAETGGINAMIVDSTALLEAAVIDTIDSAFQSAGQRCSACRVVCVQEDIADQFNDMLAGAMAKLQVGDPAKLSTDVGPVIDTEARDNIQRNTDRLERDARLIARTPEVAGDVNGTFIRPAAYEISALSELKQEIFGPVLHVVRFKSNGLEALVEDINALGYGLTMGVHSRIDETMERVARRARIGNIYVNRNQIGAVVGVQPFGGEGFSGTGPKAGGPHYLSALTNRSRPEGGGSPNVADGEITKAEQAALSAAANAYLPWSLADRSTILQQAFSAAGDNASLDMVGRMLAALSAQTELPGPTGEANTLKQRGRGVALCLGGNGALINQVACALAAGNPVLALHDDAMAALSNALDKSGAPDGLLTVLGENTTSALLLDDRISAVVFDGGEKGRAEIESVLARRSGPIIPLLSTMDEPWRFATERTLTINTTAAGGDVRLLSLTE
ncbi:bifunctional proline dehydrogenase/L-glutamate gamma-semialdehyde dehydrogenase PutA [Hyphococcus sp.]|uniref:bifunctional proline dehydrogenase/L-glutamate gamma-semialdehyde dehydrogenase PutA n=1 Tax=Hyphococcus sp. TaxID=2038636 RepID=UPI003CCBFF61